MYINVKTGSIHKVAVPKVAQDCLLAGINVNTISCIFCIHNIKKLFIKENNMPKSRHYLIFELLRV